MGRRWYSPRSPLIIILIGGILIGIGWVLPSLPSHFKWFHIPEFLMSNAPWAIVLLGGTLALEGMRRLLGRDGPFSRAWSILRSARFMWRIVIVEVRGSDLDFDKTEILDAGADVYVILHDGYRFFEIYKRQILERFVQNKPTHIVICDPKGPNLAELARKSNKKIDEQLGDLNRAIEFYRAQQKASPASNVELRLSTRLLTYSFIGTKTEAILALYPTSHRWEHRPSMHLKSVCDSNKKAFLDSVMEDVYMTLRDARELDAEPVTLPSGPIRFDVSSGPSGLPPFS